MATPAGKLFYQNRVSRMGRYERTWNRHDCDGVKLCENMITTMDDMEEKDKRSANHESDIVSYIKGDYGVQSSVME